jgi:hypothetical protein
MPKPTVNILKEKNSGDFLVEHFAVHPKIGASVGWRMRDRFSRGEFQKIGLDSVLKSLRDYPLRKNADQQIKVFRVTGAKGSLDDVKAHICLGVRVNSPGALALSPTHRERGGYVGHRDDEIQLKLPCTPDQFFQQIEKTFELCS